jgi:transcriptional regulator with XRE-family HTH domain
MGRRHRHWRESLMAIMEPESDETSTAQVSVGRRLNELRNAQGLSIRSLADMSGLNFNTLSLIENEKSSPSVNTLQQLARALRVPITAFFDAAPEKRDLVYQKEGQRPMADFPNGSLEDLGNGLTLGHGAPLLITLEPGAGSGPDPIVHTGQEFVYCLEGCLTYIVAGQEYALESGDSLIFQAALPHCWENAGDCLTRSLFILCPADENDPSAGRHFMAGQAEGKEE